ncbi:aminotransferase class V-fold PLP-dependent enzyme [Nonomuraea sp. NPDC003754]
MMDWPQVRELFTIDPDLIHLNTAGLGSAPRPVLDVIGGADRVYARSPRDPFADTALTDVRESLAGGLGCEADELAVVPSATDANARILAGLDLREGDEIITTDHECYTVRAPLCQLRDRRGVVLRELTPPVGAGQRAEEIVELVRSAITPRTRVLQWAGITLTTGAAFPTAELVELARRHDLITVLDGSQVLGHVPLRLRELGVDFLSASGSRYQCGPMGTGLIYARNRPLPLPVFWPIVSLLYPLRDGLPARPHDLGRLLQQSDSADLSRAQGLRIACELWDRIGRDRIRRHVLELSAHLKERVVHHWGRAALLSPLDDPRLHSGLVAFDPFGGSADIGEFVQLKRQLADEHGITVEITRFARPGVRDELPAVRVSPHLYNDVEQIDRAIDTMIKLCR